MAKQNQQDLIDKFNSALSEYRKGKLTSAFDILIQIRREKVLKSEEEIYEQSEELISKIKKIQGLRRSRYILVTTAVVIFLALVIGLSIKKNESFVTFSVQTGQFKFDLGEDLVSNPININDIDLSGINDLSIPVKSLKIANYDTIDRLQWRSVLDQQKTILIRKTDPSWSVHIKSDYVVLEFLKLKDSTSVTIEKDDNNKKQISINVNKGAAFGSIDTDDSIILTCNLCELVYDNETVPIDGISLMLELITPQMNFKKRQNSALQLSFEPNYDSKHPGQFHAGDNVLIKSIDFTKIRADKIISTINGQSSLRFNNFQNRAYDINANEFLILDGLRNFQLVEIDLINDIRVRGTGYVGIISMGSDLSRKNYMPNYIEWIVENEKIKLLIAILFPVFSVILAMLYRLKIIDEN